MSRTHREPPPTEGVVRSSTERRAVYEDEPLTRQEYISAIVHLYRGELDRATNWRNRLDTTTNWAILTTAGLLTFSYGGDQNSHWVLLLGFVLVTILLGYEARRFRFFDVWRARVRKIEENFYGPILRRDPVSPERDWGERVAEDLLNPSFKISLLAAVRARFTRNYWAIYGVLTAAWTVKIFIHSPVPHGWPEVKSFLAAGPIPWWGPLAYLAVFALGALGLLWLAPRSPQSELEYWSEFATTKDLSILDM
jgi:uncharacterized membrane protein